MRTTIQNLLSIISACFVALLAISAQTSTAQLILNVVETGGDNDANDTVVAKWTGQTWSDHAANEPINGITTGQPYTVGRFGSHAATFVDRNHRYTNATPAVAIPPYLIGGEYIMNGNDNRDNPTMTMDVTVSAAVRVYLFIDNRLSDANGLNPPTFDAAHMQWVVDEGWVAVKTGLNQVGDPNLPDEVGIDEAADGTINQQFSIYRKDFPAGTFRLKQADNAGQNMYGAVVTAAPPPPQLLANFLNIGGNKIGTVTPNLDGTITIVGGGNDIWDGRDEFTYAYKEVIGDFDVKVKVESLTPNATWSKAGIMVRESLSEFSRMAFPRVTPDTGANDTRFAYRTGIEDPDGVDPYLGTDSGGAHEDCTECDNQRPTNGHRWVRLVRAGAVLTASSSADGSTWVALGTQDTATWGGGALSKSLYVGLGTSRHSGGPSATAEYSSFSIDQGGFGLLQASSRGNPNAILVSFSSAPDAATLLPLGFDVPGITITGISPGPSANSYWLNVDPSTPLVEGTSYSVAAFSVTAGGGTISPSPDTDTFVHGAGYEARRIRISHNKTGDAGYYRGSDAVAGGIGDVIALGAGAVFPAVEGNTVFEDPVPDNGTNERFSSRVSGVLDITTSGAYTFYMSSDDVGYLYLSSNEEPISKTQIANEPQWNGVRQYIAGGNQASRGVPPSNISAPINLVAGQKYYLELVYTEGGGGNNGSATWLPPGGAAVANGTEPIPASAFAPSRVFGGSKFNNLGPVSITRQPANQTVIGGNPVTFSAGIDGTPAYRIQWLRNGQPIPGANRPTYTIPVTLGTDDGARFSASVANEFSSATSAEAVLTVNIPLPPVLTSAAPDETFGRVTVKFDKRVQPSSAQNTANYTLTGGVTVNSATLDAAGTGVVLATSPMAQGTTYTLTVRDVMEVTGNNALTPNPTTVTFSTAVFSPGFAKKEYYQQWTAGGGSVDAFIAAQRAGTTPITRECYVNLWEQNTADEYENYGGRIFGFFVAPVSGDYVFYFASDDFGRLFLSTDESPANLVEIAREPVWSGRRTWTGEAGGGGRGTPPVNISVPISLVGGQKYYMESYFTEGGGGDNMAVTVQGPGDPVPVNNTTLPVGGAYIGTFASPAGASASITQHPVDATRAENTFATFTAAGTGASSACGSVASYQWYRNGVPIAGANGTSLTVGPVTIAADNGAMFKVRVGVVGAYADSAEAVLTVIPPQPLKVVRAEGVCNLTQVRVVYDQFLDPITSQDVFNYTSDSFLISSAVLNPDNVSVTLTLDPTGPAQIPGANYCVRIGGVANASGLFVDPNPTTACFQACVLSCGFALQEIYQGPAGVTIADLLADPNYPNNPSIRRYVGGVTANTGDEFDNYGTRISGYIIPPVSGDYVFYLASDDGGDFSLSTDSSPANLQLLATEPIWASRRNFIGEAEGGGRAGVTVNGGPQANISRNVNLVAGQQYYFEARMKEAGGGDNLDVAWKIPGGPEPVDGGAPISGAFLASLANPVGASVNITQQPTDQCAEEGTVATFTVAINATVGGAPAASAFYQWYRMTPGGQWLPVGGAVNATYAPTVTAADHGNKYRVAIYVPGATATSAEATLSTFHVNTPPLFTGGADQTSACAASASVPGWATGIQNHSITRTPVTLASDFASAAGIDLRGGVADASLPAWTGANVSGGVLHLTDAGFNSAYGAASVGFPLRNFETISANWKSRIGGGGDGADGYSLSISDDLPIDPGYGGEEGIGNGLRVTVDTFDNGGLEDGIDIKWRGNQVAFQHITKNDTGDGIYLRKDTFVDASLTVDGAGLATLTYDGQTISATLPGYTGISATRLLFWARTGGANDNHWIDDFAFTGFPYDASSVESGQTVAFEVTTDNAALFTSGPAVSPTGTLSYTLAACAQGSANVTVVLKDDGGTATCAGPRGSDTSAAHTFKINVTPDTAPPTITCPANITTPATSAAGAVVTYTAATAADNCAATVVCAPASGSTFAAGTTTPVTCTATDCAGLTATCTFTVTVTPSGQPPVAVINSEQLIDLRPEFENPVLLSCNWWNACLVVDGWTSSGVEPLTYLWFLEGDPTPIGAGPVITNCLEVGTHTIILIVTDANGLTAEARKTIEVVTAPLAIDLLIEQINEAHKHGVLLDRKTKRELTATLRVALEHAGDNELRQTQKALDAFEKKVRAQVADTYPVAAQSWIRWSQAISAGMEKCIKPPRKPKDHHDDKKDADDKDVPR